jgi:DNA replication protein DnaC
MKTDTEPQPAFALTQFIKRSPELMRIAERHGWDIGGHSYNREQSSFFSIRACLLQDKTEKETAHRILQEFDEWTQKDPEGIAAKKADIEYGEWVESEKRRVADEKWEAEHREQIERNRDELREIIGHKLTRLDFDHPDIDRAAVEKFLAWHNREWDENGKLFFHTNALLTGPSGTGKTRALAQAALWYCGQGFTADWVTGYEFAELVGNLSTDRRADANERLREITEAPTLYFDDLGSANFTTARTSRFFRLVDERHRNDLPTIFTSNYNTAQLKKIFAATAETREQAIGIRETTEEAVRILRRMVGTPAEPLASIFHFKRQEAKR